MCCLNLVGICDHWQKTRAHNMRNNSTTTFLNPSIGTGLSKYWYIVEARCSNRVVLMKKRLHATSEHGLCPVSSGPFCTLVTNTPLSLKCNKSEHLSCVPARVNQALVALLKFKN